MIYCVGENLEERESEHGDEVIINQLNEIKSILEETGGWDNVIIAYEPIWALNTGKVSSAD